MLGCTNHFSGKAATLDGVDASSSSGSGYGVGSPVFNGADASSSSSSGSGEGDLVIDVPLEMKMT
jgi:hypothetical protein